MKCDFYISLDILNGLVDCGCGYLPYWIWPAIALCSSKIESKLVFGSYLQCLLSNWKNSNIKQKLFVGIVSDQAFNFLTLFLSIIFLVLKLLHFALPNPVYGFFPFWVVSPHPLPFLEPLLAVKNIPRFTNLQKFPNIIKRMAHFDSRNHFAY